MPIGRHSIIIYSLGDKKSDSRRSVGITKKKKKKYCCTAVKF